MNEYRCREQSISTEPDPPRLSGIRQSQGANSRAASSRPTLLKLTFAILLKTILFSSIPFPAEKVFDLYFEQVY